MIFRWLVLLLIALPCSAQTWSTWNGKAVGSSTGNVSSINGKTIGASAGNYSKWNNLSATGGVSWTHVQSPAFARCAAGTTCTSSLAATTANSVLVVTAYGVGTNSHLTGCTGGGGTWVTGTSSSFVAWDATTANLMAMAYNITGAGGATSVTCTFANSQSAPIVAVSEWTRSTGVPTLDQLAASNLNTSSCVGTCTLSSFSGLTGTSDLLVQSLNTGVGVANPSSPYVWDDQDVTIYALNSTQTTAPTLSQTGGSMQSLGVAFK